MKAGSMRLINHTISRARMFGMMKELEELGEPAISLYLPPGSNAADIATVQQIPHVEEIPPGLVQAALKSATGAVFFWGRSHKYLIMPPFNVLHRSVLYGYSIEGLKSILAVDYLIAVMLLRLGAYGIGLFGGEGLLQSKVGKGLVHSRHKKGGSSQRRFERHRLKQMEYFFSRVCEKAVEKLSPYLQQIDHVYYGGEKNTINLFVRQCEFCADLRGRVAARLLNIREPGQEGLLRSIKEVYSCRAMEAIPQNKLD
jgi:hypothetical protein